MAKKQAKKQSAEGLVDAQLERYRSMRDFEVTSEPSGDKSKDKKAKSETGLPFVIQKHAASHLHYDFRLGWNGVLKSWAVAKGPSYFTGDKRLAVQVEDHPIEYGGFEGIIPKGQYGGGTVMVWDQGTWEPQAAYPDVDAGLRDGSLKITMHGTKMKGNWALVRMGGKAANEKKPNWLLIKEHDGFERKESDTPITEEAPDSAVTGRSLEEIAENQDHTWNSNRAADKQDLKAAKQPLAASASAKSKAAPASKTKAAMSLAAYPKETLPKFVTPQLALLAESPPEGSEWLHELKLDGYRVQARKNGETIQLLTRTGLDWTHRMKPVAAAVAKLDAKTALFDGEVVVLADDGTTSFANLQAAFKDGAKHAMAYFIFDLLHLDGHDLKGAPLIERKTLLASIIERSRVDESIRLSEHIQGNGVEIFKGACKVQAEGIVSKRATAKYSSGRTSDWLKIKCGLEQELVIGGFTLPSNGTHGVGALLLGYYDGDGQLVYAGRTGTGFTQKVHRMMRDRLNNLRSKKNPFVSIASAAARGAIWVSPELVAQVSFATWTADHLVRQAAFKGLREDKPANEVVREEPSSLTTKDRTRKSSKTSPDPVQSKAAAPGNDGVKRGPKPVSTEGQATIRLTHPDKILDPQSGLTKRQVADYYWAIAEHMLPEIANRPLSLVRCPDGCDKPCFFQKHTNHLLPTGVRSVDVPDKKTGKIEPYITLSTREALAGLAQIGVLEVHPWGSHNDNLERPDRIVIDLDPDESISWRTLADAAKEARALLKKLKLESFLKGTGGKGLHVVVPIVPEHDWGAIKQLAHAIAEKLESQQPRLYLTTMSKAERKGRIYIDYLRNERGATAVAAYSPRARAGAGVSLPLAWAELDETERPVFPVAEFNKWKDRLKKNPWKNILILNQKIDLDAVAAHL